MATKVNRSQTTSAHSLSTQINRFRDLFIFLIVPTIKHAQACRRLHLTAHGILYLRISELTSCLDHFLMVWKYLLWNGRQTGKWKKLSQRKLPFLQLWKVSGKFSECNALLSAVSCCTFVLWTYAFYLNASLIFISISSSFLIITYFPCIEYGFRAYKEVNLHSTFLPISRYHAIPLEFVLKFF